MKYHYTYKVEHAEGWFYFGKRTCGVEPHRDVTYMGSGRLIKEKMKEFQSGWVKTILGSYETHQECSKAENDLLVNFSHQPKNLNLIKTSGVNLSYNDSSKPDIRKWKPRTPEHTAAMIAGRARARKLREAAVLQGN